MDYFSILDLDKEPFSNSPDPLFFYEARQHVTCLQQLELAIRLRRGLNVVMGAVGIGKTTLCRELVRRLAKDTALRVRLVLDPSFSTGDEFLEAVETLLLGDNSGASSPWQRKERIKNFLFKEGVENNRTIVLLIDEGQKISVQCLEIIREFLNYETNTRKLLQVVIFAQEEFTEHLDDMENFQDRINLIFHLRPMTFRDMRTMILFRLRRSGSLAERLPSFSLPALWLVYRLTRGYPRKVVNICHRILLTIIVQGKRNVTYKNVLAASQRTPLIPDTSRRFNCMVTTVLLVLTFAVGIWFAQGRRGVTPSEIISVFSSFGEQKNAPETTPKDGSVPADTSLAPNPVEERSPGKRMSVHVNASLPESLPETVPSLSSSAYQELASENGSRNLFFADTLGVIEIQERDTLFALVRGIYSVQTTSGIHPYVLEILKKNSGIVLDPDDLEVGIRLVLPTPSPVKAPIAPNRFWVEITQTSSLENAYRMATDDHLPLRVVIHWNPRQKFRYTLVLPRFFAQRSAAQAEAASLPRNAFHPVVVDADAFNDDILFSSLP